MSNGRDERKKESVEYFLRIFEKARAESIHVNLAGHQQAMISDHVKAQAEEVLLLRASLIAPRINARTGGCACEVGWWQKKFARMQAVIYAEHTADVTSIGCNGALFKGCCEDCSEHVKRLAR